MNVVAWILGLALLGTLIALEIRVSRRLRAKERAIQTEIDKIAEVIDARFQRQYGRKSATLAQHFPRLGAGQ
jgi:hypothetical protein